MRTAFNKPVLLLAGIALLPTLAVLIVGGALISTIRFYPFIFVPPITWNVLLCIALPGLMLIGLMLVLRPGKRPFIPWRWALTTLLAICLGIWLAGRASNAHHYHELTNTRFKDHSYHAVLYYYNESGPEAVLSPSILVYECDPSGLFCEGISTYWEGRRPATEVREWEGYFTVDLDNNRLFLYVKGALAFFKDFSS